MHATDASCIHFINLFYFDWTIFYLIFFQKEHVALHFSTVSEYFWMQKKVPENLNLLAHSTECAVCTELCNPTVVILKCLWKVNPFVRLFSKAASNQMIYYL